MKFALNKGLEKALNLKDWKAQYLFLFAAGLLTVFCIIHHYIW